MEDTSLSVVSLPQGESLFAIFDGHGGHEVARFCKEELEKTLTENASYKTKDYEKALKESFITLDDKLRTLEGQNKIV